MSHYDINSNPALVKLILENQKKTYQAYCREHPDSLIPLFEKELRDLGYGFEVYNQIIGFMPKHKETILPIAIRYYQKARELSKDNEQNYFMSFFHFKGFEEVVPMLLEDFYSNNPDIDKWAIGACLYQIRSPKYIDDYLGIIADSDYGINRQMIVLLVGKLKVEKAIPVLIHLLDKKDVGLHAISALGNYKREEFRPIFERYLQSENKALSKEAKRAIQKLDAQANKKKVV